LTSIFLFYWPGYIVHTPRYYKPTTYYNNIRIIILGIRLTRVGVLLRHRGVRHAGACLERDSSALVIRLAGVYALRQGEQGQLLSHRMFGRRTGRVPGEQFEVDVAASVALKWRGWAGPTRQHRSHQRQRHRHRGESPRVRMHGNNSSGSSSSSTRVGIKTWQKRTHHEIITRCRRNRRNTYKYKYYLFQNNSMLCTPFSRAKFKLFKTFWSDAMSITQ